MVDGSVAMGKEGQDMQEGWDGVSWANIMI